MKEGFIEIQGDKRKEMKRILTEAGLAISAAVATGTADPALDARQELSTDVGIGQLRFHTRPIMTDTLRAKLSLLVLAALSAAPLQALTFRSSEQVLGRLSEFEYLSGDGKTIAGTCVISGRAAAYRFSESAGFQILATGLPPVTQGVWATGMSADGGVVFGGVGYDSGGTTYAEGFVWTEKNGCRLVGQLGNAHYSACRTISPDGQTIGGQTIDGDNVVSCFLWTEKDGIKSYASRFPDFPAGATSPDSISNDASTAWLTFYSDRGPHVFRWTAGQPLTEYLDLPGGGDSLQFRDVTSDGALAFGAGATDTGYQAVRLKPDGSLELVFPEAPYQTFINAVTSDGRFVVAYVDHGSDASSSVADDSLFLDRQTGRRTLLSEIVSSRLPEAAKWTGLYALAIADDGDTVIGSGIDPQGNLNGWLLEGVKELIAPDPSVTFRAGKRLVLNRQTGLLEQSVHVKNSGAVEIKGLDVSVGGLPAKVRLYNATGHKRAKWYYHQDRPLPAGASVDLILKYYNPLRRTGFLPNVGVLPSMESIASPEL